MRDFVPLSLVGSAPQLLVVNPAVPAKSVAELIQLAKTKPGTFNFGSGGAGTLAYIGGEMFKSMAGIDIVHISYKGTVLALNDLVGGQVQLMFSDMPIALPHARSGKLRALAVTGARRTPLVPEMPTVAEAGMPGYALDNWWGILAPRGVPPDLVVKLNAEIVRIHGLAEVKERYAGLGVEAVSSTSTSERYPVSHRRSTWPTGAAGADPECRSACPKIRPRRLQPENDPLWYPDRTGK